MEMATGLKFQDHKKFRLPNNKNQLYLTIKEKINGKERINLSYKTEKAKKEKILNKLGDWIMDTIKRIPGGVLIMFPSY